MHVIKKGEALPDYTPLRLPNIGGGETAVAPSLWHEEKVVKPLAELFAAQASAAAPAAMLKEDPAQIVEQARAEAAQILNEATARVNEIERAARDAAISEARASLAAEAAAEAAALRLQLTQTLEEVAQLREQMATYAEHEMVQLALEIAKKIVRREVTVDREIVISLARVALSRLHNRVLAVVRMHPEDYQYVVSHREKLGTNSTVKLIEDVSISRGGCLIETDFGDVDARIEQQFNEIERGFLNNLSA